MSSVGAGLKNISKSTEMSFSNHNNDNMTLHSKGTVTRQAFELMCPTSVKEVMKNMAAESSRLKIHVFLPLSSTVLATSFELQKILLISSPYLMPYYISLFVGYKDVSRSCGFVCDSLDAISSSGCLQQLCQGAVHGPLVHALL